MVYKPLTELFFITVLTWFLIKWSLTQLEAQKYRNERINKVSTPDAFDKNQNIM